MTSRADPGVVLAFDFGLKRVGVASGNLHTRTASPLTTLTMGAGVPWPQIDALVKEWRPGTIVLGLPDESRGRTAIASAARQFAADLTRYGIPVETVDESFSSTAAAAELREGRRSGGITRRLGKAAVDRYAACLIAEQWMSAAQT